MNSIMKNEWIKKKVISIHLENLAILPGKKSHLPILSPIMVNFARAGSLQYQVWDILSSCKMLKYIVNQFYGTDFFPECFV
jgi:hypothetical protein